MRAQASFNPKRQDVVKDAFIICIANSVFSLVSAMTVFSVLGFMATEQRVCVADVTEGGPGLAFIAFPKALSMMPGSNFFSLLFFLMLIFVFWAFGLAMFLLFRHDLPQFDSPSHSLWTVFKIFWG